MANNHTACCNLLISNAHSANDRSFTAAHVLAGLYGTFLCSIDHEKRNMTKTTWATFINGFLNVLVYGNFIAVVHDRYIKQASHTLCQRRGQTAIAILYCFLFGCKTFPMLSKWWPACTDYYMRKGIRTANAVLRLGDVCLVRAHCCCCAVAVAVYWILFIEIMRFNRFLHMLCAYPVRSENDTIGAVSFSISAQLRTVDRINNNQLHNFLFALTICNIDTCTTYSFPKRGSHEEKERRLRIVVGPRQLF